MEITPSTLEPNLIPIEIEDINIQEGMDIGATPQANTPASASDASNLEVSSNGTVVALGTIQSSNFRAGSNGWRLDSNGNIEANDGNFRGDITGATGTFTGTITATTGSIGGWTISSVALYLDGATDAVSSGMAPADYPFYAGKKYADRATAPFRVTPAGALTATNATITGDITANNIVINNLAWNRVTAMTSFESFDGFSTKEVGTSTFTPYFLGGEIQTGATDGNYGVLYSNPANITGAVYIQTDKKPLLQITCRVQDSDYAEGFVGIAQGSGTYWTLDDGVGTSYFGFSLKSGYSYAVSRKNGETINSTQIGASIDSFQNYRAEFTATAIYFYRNNVLVATHTTNLPSMDTADIYMGVKNFDDGGEQTMQLVNMLFSQDFDSYI